jgi:cellulose synthase/poly-beta-1,6-N-acetylglucosamine synthase-like glycosyltransferase
VALVEALARSSVLLVEVILAVPVAYLIVLSLAALAAHRAARKASTLPEAAPSPSASAVPLPHFAILIPAHDEADGIAQAVQSALAVAYPAERRSVIVVADNCTDGTAALARAAGARVYERSSEQQRAKGYALGWLLQQLAEEGASFDAYVIVDADSQLSANFLSHMANALAQGAAVAQAQYRVLNDEQSWTAGLRAVAFALFNHLRPLGRSRLGWSAGLKGNGMCFSAAVLERFGWDAHSLAEDAEFHLRLLDAGIHVVYVPEARVAAEMPVTLQQARTQQARWEGGRLALARERLGPLLRGYLRDGDAARLDAAMELLLPPLSLVLGLILCCLPLALLLHATGEVLLALALLAALALHVAAGSRLAELPGRAYLALLGVPLYIWWKCWVYIRALVGRRGGAWIRTQRTSAR